MFSTARLAARARRKGFLLDVECDEVPLQSKTSVQLLTDAEQRWQVERKQKNPQLRRVIWKNVRNPLVLGAICMLLRGFSNTLSLPLLLKIIIDSLVDGELEQFKLYTFLLVAERAVAAAVETLGGYLLTARVPEDFVGTIAGLVARKALTPGVQGLSKVGVNPGALVGRELQMVSTQMAFTMRAGLMGLPCIVAGSITLIMLLGWPSILGILWTVFTIRLGMSAQQRAKRNEQAMSTIATARLAILANVIGAIKAIKFFTWELDFLDELLKARQKECVAIRRKTFMQAIAVGLAKLTPVTGSFITFVTYVLLGNTIRASDIFACNSVFMTMRFAVGAGVALISISKSLDVVMSRSAKLLALQERQPLEVQPIVDHSLAHVSDLCVTFPQSESATSVQNGSLIDESGKGSLFQLKSHGSLCIGKRGQLTAICGTVGSGKSTLLLTLLGSLDGDAAVTGAAGIVESVGWCPQKAFTISASVRDNILLGREYDEDKMVRCLADSCFGTDVEQLPNRLDEVVGERGTTLSGGQQARLSVARALYADPTLVALDDPLAAVDAAVGRAMLRALRIRCTADKPAGYSQSGAVSGAVIVVNQLHLLPNFEQIIFLNAGSVEAHGTFAQLMQHPVFARFMEGIEPQQIPVQIASDEEVAKCELHKARASLHSLKDGAGSSFIQKEMAGTGLLSWRILRSYLFAPGTWFFVLTTSTYLVTFVTLGLRDWWLSVWADAGGGQKFIHIGTFTLLSGLHAIGCVGCATLTAFFAERASKNLHSDCARRLLQTKMSYFDETPSGRITSRFGPDLGQVDGLIPNQLDMFTTFVFTVLILGVGIVVNVPLLAILLVLALACSVPVARGIAVVAQDAKRHSNNAMAPILSNLAEMQRGAALARVLGCQDFFLLRHQHCSDYWAVRFSVSLVCTPLSGSWCHFMHIIFLAAAALLAIWDEDNLRASPGLAAMFFSYAGLLGLFADALMAFTLGLMTNFTSLERLLDYKLEGLPQEPRWNLQGDPALDSWPNVGAVHFSGVAFRYREDAPRALDDFNLLIAGGEKLGVVGRTGAGKSTLTNALFRLVECEDGAISIDGVNIANLGLHTLRRAVSMIPQEPIVLTGTVRYNLDPFGKFNEDSLQNALKCCGLAQSIDLDTLAGGLGSALSSGQLQLLTFARIVLQPKQIIMMDEPTASVDMQTDKLVQQVVRESFSQSTVMIIAHRLETVLGYCDRIAVLEAGRLVEIGAPNELIKNPKGHLAHLIQAGETGTLNSQSVTHKRILVTI